MFGSSNDGTFMPRRGQLSGLYDQCREEDQLSSKSALFAMYITTVLPVPVRLDMFSNRPFLRIHICDILPTLGFIYDPFPQHQQNSVVSP